jgi:hypothetical protein
MKAMAKIGVFGLPALVMAGLFSASGRAQTPATVAPIVVDTAVPIIVSTVNAVKARSKTAGLGKFEGYVMNANNVQITVRAKGNDMSLETFTLSQAASTSMQTIVDKGGYQYGDKVTVFYDPTTKTALKVKGKPSKPI